MASKSGLYGVGPLAAVDPPPMTRGGRARRDARGRSSPGQPSRSAAGPGARRTFADPAAAQLRRSDRHAAGAGRLRPDDRRRAAADRRGAALVEQQRWRSRRCRLRRACRRSQGRPGENRLYELAKSLNSRLPGARSHVLRAARTLADPASAAKTDLVKADPFWGERDTWAAIRLGDAASDDILSHERARPALDR